MTLEDAYYISQIIAAVAIVSSLIFVALQLRQADQTQRAAMHQGRTQRGMDMALRASDPQLIDAMGHIIRIDPATTPSHFLQVNSLIRAMVLNLDDVEWQRGVGLLDQATLDNTVAPMRRLLAIPGVRAVWQMSRSGFSPKTAALVDRLVVGDAPLETNVADPISAWRAIAAQMAAPAGV